MKSLSYNRRLLQLGLPSLELRRLHLDLVFCDKIVPVNLDDFFEIRSVLGTRGHPFKLFKSRCSSNIRSIFFCWACHKYMEQCAINCKFLYVSIISTNNSQCRFFTVYEVQLTLMYFIFRVYGSYECHALTFLSSFYLMLLSTCILLCANKHRWMDDLAVFRRYKSIIVTWHKHYIRFSTWFLFYFYICQ